MNTYEKGNIIGRIEQDEYAEDPRTIFDHLGTMYCVHKRYDLGDVQCSDEDEMIEAMYENLTGRHLSDDLNEFEEDREKHYELHGAEDENEYDVDAEVEAERKRLIEEMFETHVILPLYLYDHSGITMSVSPFSCRWDSGQVGYIAAKKGGEDMTDERIKTCLEAEVKEYDTYLTGEIYGYVVERRVECPCCGNVEMEVLNSCSGYYDPDLKHITEEMRRAVDAFAEEEKAV